MSLKLVKRTTIWWPTLLGWAGLLVVVTLVCSSWIFVGEPFLSKTTRLPANVLVVEGWIGPTGVQAALVEFRKYNYDHIVMTSGLTGARWDEERWSYAVEAAKIARHAGIVDSKIILAVPKETEVQRTYEAALAVRDALKKNSLTTNSVNVFTKGVHAKRSRLVFEKTLGPEHNVGAISWSPPGYEAEPWWSSSERMIDLLKETVAYTLEVMFNSGRRTNSTTLEPMAVAGKPH